MAIPRFETKNNKIRLISKIVQGMFKKQFENIVSLVTL